MSTTFVKGLALLELIDERGPVGISDIARALGMDKGAVSRMVAAVEADGWIARQDGGVVIGPRASALGSTTPVARAAERIRPVVAALAGLTGLLAQALTITGDRAAPMVSVDSAGGSFGDRAMHGALPVWVGAGPKVVGSQLGAETLDRILPADPLPRADTSWAFVPDEMRRTPPADDGETFAAERRLLERDYDRIRHDGYFLERGEVLPDSSCIAVPWRDPVTPWSLAIIGSRAEIAAGRERILALLRAAAEPAATRDDVARAAAAYR
jgi:DNA-binding IclR family transcriptional regulator